MREKDLILNSLLGDIPSAIVSSEKQSGACWLPCTFIQVKFKITFQEFRKFNDFDWGLNMIATSVQVARVLVVIV